jgi:hypothetical protein
VYGDGFPVPMVNAMQVEDTPYVHMELLESGILVARYKRGALLTLDMAKVIVRARFKLTGLEARPVLVVNQGLIGMEKAALRYLSSGEGVRGIKAAAVLMLPLSTNFIMSFVQGWPNRMPFPAKAFMREGPALRWLANFV